MPTRPFGSNQTPQVPQHALARHMAVGPPLQLVPRKQACYVARDGPVEGVVAPVELLLHLVTRERFGRHDGVNHVVVCVVGILGPPVSQGGLMDFRSGIGREDGVYRQMSVQLEREPPELLYRLRRVPPRAHDQHGLREDVVVVENLHRAGRVANSQPLLEILQDLGGVALDTDEDPAVPHLPQLRHQIGVVGDVVRPRLEEPGDVVGEIPLAQLPPKLLSPTPVIEVVIRQPKELPAESLMEMLHLIRYPRGRFRPPHAAPVLPLRAEGASVLAAPRAFQDHVPGTLAGHHGEMILPDVLLDEMICGEWQGIQILDQRALRCVNDPAVVPERKPFDPPDVLSIPQGSDQLYERHFPLSPDDVIDLGEVAEGILCRE